MKTIKYNDADHMCYRAADLHLKLSHTITGVLEWTPPSAIDKASLQNVSGLSIQALWINGMQRKIRTIVVGNVLKMKPFADREKRSLMDSHVMNLANQKTKRELWSTQERNEVVTIFFD